MQRDAVFSPGRLYRYELERKWDERLGTVLFVMLNPSTADASVDDATVERCIGYAASWGYGTLLVGNLFALRSTDPSKLKRVSDPVGPGNDDALRSLASRADLVLAAWGARGILMGRDQTVLEMLDVEWHALAETKAGQPHHPLYLRKDLSPYPYSQTKSETATR